MLDVFRATEYQNFEFAIIFFVINIFNWYFADIKLSTQYSTSIQI